MTTTEQLQIELMQTKCLLQQYKENARWKVWTVTYPNQRIEWCETEAMALTIKQAKGGIIGHREISYATFLEKFGHEPRIEGEPGFRGESTIEKLLEENRVLKNKLEAFSQWHPIETAPKDGTPILASGKAERFPRHCVTVKWMPNAFSNGQGGWCDFTSDNPDDGAIYCALTHWMAIPEQPKD